MKKSDIPNGQMFIHFTKPIFDNKDMPKVWVKVANETIGEEEVSLFVDNEAMAKISIGALKKFGIRDKWNITDGYYGKMVQKGEFVPVDDLNEVNAICIEKGYPKYEIDF